jgi:hypothetical protein
MGFDSPTTADYARHAAEVVADHSKKLEARVKALEALVQKLEERVRQLEHPKRFGIAP